MRATLIATAALLAPLQVGAQEALVGDRPDFTESAVVVRRLQLEGGTTFADAGEAHSLAVGELLVRIPAGDRFELRAGLGSWNVIDRFESSFTGWSDVSAGVKVALTQGGEGSPPQPGTALLIETSLPYGRLAESRYATEVRLAGGWALSPRLGLGANLGYLFGEGLDPRGAFGSVSAGWSASDRLGLFAEAYSERDPDGDSRVFADGGVTWLVSPNAQLDLRAGVSLRGAPERYAGIGVVLRR